MRQNQIHFNSFDCCSWVSNRKEYHNRQTENLSSPGKEDSTSCDDFSLVDLLTIEGMSLDGCVSPPTD